MRTITMVAAVSVCMAWMGAYAAPPALTVLQDLTEQTGGSPEYPPIIGQNGVLYGTAYTLNNGGAIYSINPDGTDFAVLYAFPGGAAGAGPFGGLVQDASGLLYGTTLFGGTSAQGAVYQFDPATQTATVLHSFDVADGASPYAGLVQDDAGNFYGTTSSGGANAVGTIYKIAAGSFAFTKLADLSRAVGAAPFTPLLDGKDGFLYGTAQQGGSQDKGTIFRISASSGEVEVLHSFSGSDGASPFAGLTEGKKGVYYGTTDYGGTNDQGVVFAFTLAGRKLTVLHRFRMTDGSYPQGRIALDRAGRLFGTAFAGGTNDSGVIYRYDPATSTFKVLENLLYSVAGLPGGGLTYAGGKLFYGGTLSGGTSEFASGAIIAFSE
jgi:uncharacterized repeat protein (TIGR03803 family)